ncbi:sulfatase-like hydrolase/transferase [soil metagenome]
MAAAGSSTAAAILLGMGLHSTAQLAQAADKTRAPNVILILADDFGYECVGVDGGTSYKTPNLDKLAAGGVRFDRCYVQPLCTPTRTQLMTGLYNVRNYIEFGLLDPKATTFAHLFKAAGYVTGISGKWQLGGDGGGGGKFDDPKHFGFDEYCLWQLTRRGRRYANPQLECDGKLINDEQGKYGPDVINDYALDFIKRHKDQPFMLYYPLMLTHNPYPPTPDSPDWDPKAMGDKVGHAIKHFGDMTQYMDKLIGTIVDRVEELGLSQDTLIIFLGDNGTGRDVTSRMGDRVVHGGKGSTTSAGEHVPMIVRWPGTIAPGKTSTDLIDSTDLFPTMCEAANVTIPAALNLDGHSFYPQLRGEKGKPREWYYSWYGPAGGPTPKGEFAASDRYKLYRDGRFVDYLADPEEKTELRDENLPAAAVAAKQMLEGVLEDFKYARPDALKVPRKAVKGEQ